MKKILGVIFFIAIVGIGFSQPAPTNYFSKNSGELIKQLNSYFNSTARQDLKDLVDELEKEIKAGTIKEENIPTIVDELNLLYARKAPPFPHYKDYLTTLLLFKKIGKDDAFFQNWNKILIDITNNQKRGENKDYQQFIGFSEGLFAQNALLVDKIKSWNIDTKEYELKNENGVVKLLVNETTITGKINGDTSLIYNTNGVFYPMTNIWEGKKGKVNWKRAGVHEDDASATFGKYSIDTKQSSFVVDSATLLFPEYFKTPVLGRLEDRLVPENSSAKSPVPRFTSYRKDYVIDNIAENVKYRGDFNLVGSKIFAKASDTSVAELTFFLKDKKTRAIVAYGNEITVKRPIRVSVDKANTVLFFGKDSLFHPQLSIDYDVLKNDLKLMRGEDGIGMSKFFSTYHKYEFDADLVHWNLDKDSIEFKMLTGAGKNPSIFSSENNFDRATHNSVRGVTPYDPLSVLKMYCDKNGGIREVYLPDLAKAYDKSLTEEQIKPLIYKLIENGFIFYDPNSKMVTVRKKTFNYVLSNTQKVDYDVLRIKAYGKDRTGIIDLINYDISLNDVKEIPLNDSSFVYAYPDLGKVALKKNRDMSFDGKMLFGRMDCYGKKFFFRYEPYNIETPQMDSMKINIPDGDKKDEEGNVILRSLTSQIERMKGLMEINAPLNKSGRTRLPQFPRVTTSGSSFVFYQRPELFDSAYKKNSFYFELNPFRLDSMNSFSPNAINFEGKLVSAKIFPEIKEKLKIQEDFSLGFKTMTPPEGLKLYENRGKFTNEIRLSNKGLIGKGKVNFLSATIESDSIIFLPKDMRTIAKNFTMKEQLGAVEFPEIEAKNTPVNWSPYSDSMAFKSADTTPMNMYSGATKFKGSMNLTSKGLYGNGSLDWSEASITSKAMRFKSATMDADTAAMQIKGLDGNKVTFNTPNVKAKIDFKNKIADFKSNTKDIATDFAYNQYKAFVNEFKWDINKKTLEFKSPIGSDVKFQSTHPKQDSIAFSGTHALYDLSTSIMNIEGVKEIIVADSKVFPDKGKITIKPEAKMETLKNAHIVGDTAHSWHKLDNVTADIFGKNDMVGYGDYNLKVNGKDQTIKMTSIKVDKKEEKTKDKKNPIKSTYTIVAKGEVTSGQNMFIYSNLGFKGNVELTTKNQFPHFDGYARVSFIKPTATTDWFRVNNDIDVNKFTFYRDSIFNEDNLQLQTGIFVDKLDMTGLYTNILKPIAVTTDYPIFIVKGLVKHEPQKNKYYFGDSAKLNGGKLKGNYIEYSDTSAKLFAEGAIKYRLRLGGIPLLAAGTIQNDLKKKRYDFNQTLAFNFPIESSVMNYISNALASEVSEQKDVVYKKQNIIKQYAELYKEKDFTKFKTEVENDALPSAPNPKDFPYNLVFTNVSMTFNDTDLAFRSSGEIPITIVGEKSIHKNVKGYIEFGYRGVADFFNIYLRTDSKEWFFFGYRNGILQIVSSVDAVNGAVAGVDAKKRTVRKSDKEFFMYTMGNAQEAKEFYERMKAGGSFDRDNRENIDKSKPSAPIEEPEEIVEPTMNPEEGEVIPSDSTKPVENKTSEKTIVPQNTENVKPKETKEEKTKESAPKESEKAAEEKGDKDAEKKKAKAEKESKAKAEKEKEEVDKKAKEDKKKEADKTKTTEENIKSDENKTEQKVEKTKEEIAAEKKKEKELEEAKAKADKEAKDAAEKAKKELEKKEKEAAAEKEKAEKEAKEKEKKEKEEADKKAKEEKKKADEKAKEPTPEKP